MQVVVEAVFKMQDRLLVAYLLSVTLFNQILMRRAIQIILRCLWILIYRYKCRHCQDFVRLLR